MTMNINEYLRATPLGLDSSARVDRENKVILGATLIQVGPVNDPRKIRVDQTTLKEVEANVNKQSGGMKCRFGHPSPFANGTLKTFLGTITSARIKGDKTIGDVHLSPLAFKASNGDIGTQVLDMAEHHPEMFGMSLAPEWDKGRMKSTKDANGTQAIRIKQLRAIDVVDDPAAAHDGMFSVDQGEFPETATQLLNYFFAEADRDAIEASAGDFLTHYLQTRFGDPTMTAIEKELKEQLATLTEKLEALSKQVEASDGTNTDDLAKQLKELTTRQTAIQTKLDESLQAAAGGGSNSNNRQSDAETLSAAATKAERERSAEILTVCQTAGCEDLALAWIQDEKLDINDVRKLVLDEQAKTNQSLGSGGGDGDGDGDGEKDPLTKKLKEEYAKQLPYMEASGLAMTEEDFIRSARISLDGCSERLEVGSDAKKETVKT